MFGVGIYFLIPLKVYAAEYPTATDLIDIINEYGDENTFIFLQFPEDYKIKDDVTFFGFLAHFQFQGYYEFNRLNDLDLFEPRLRDVILMWLSETYNDGYDTGFDQAVMGQLGIQDFTGELYWNSEQEYFQLNQFDSVELEYYKQRVEELESLVDDLNNQIDLEYDRGYNDGYDVGYDAGYDAGSGDTDDGYDVGYNDGYVVGFIAGEKSKLAKNNESFYNNIAIWIPAVITIVALASIISIFGIKKKE